MLSWLTTSSSVRNNTQAGKQAICIHVGALPPILKNNTKHAHRSVHMYVCLCMSTCYELYACVSLCVLCVCVCAYVCVCVCVCVHMCVCNMVSVW